MKFGSLFSGIEGFGIGFERAGMECVWQCEINKQCNSVRRRHWPNVPQFEDVRKLHAKDVIRPDIICGGFPCQDLSVAGRRAGLAGERSGLFHEFARLLDEIHPRWVCIENVPGLLSSWSGDSPSSLGIEAGPGREMVLEERSDLDIVTRRLADIGYRWAYRVLDAQYFGLAQRRKRVFIVGSLGDGPHPAEILFDSESLSRNPPTRGEAGTGTSEATAYRTSGNSGVMPQGNRTAALNTATDPTQNIVATLNSGGNNGGFQTEPGEHIVTHSLTMRHDSSEDGCGRGTPLVVAFQERGREGGREVNYQEDIAYSLNNPGKGGRRQENCVAFSQNQRDEIRDLDDKAGALASEPGMHQQTFVSTGFINPRQLRNSNSSNQVGIKPEAEVADAMNTDGPGAVLDSGVRRLTPRECERLQGFPDDFTRWDADGNEISDSARYRMLGNAVAVPVAEWIARRILEISTKFFPSAIDDLPPVR